MMSQSSNTNSSDEASSPACNLSAYGYETEVSSDSGKGGSDILEANLSEAQSTINHNINQEPVIIYQFEIPQAYCGRLIGYKGHFVKLIKDETNTRVVINLHPFSTDLKICTLKGFRSEIKDAITIIRNRFPPREFPEVTLNQINVINSVHTCPMPTFPLQLPAGILCDVILSSMVNAGHFFLQQPTHPTYPSLNRLYQCMSANYSQLETPPLPHVHSGMICAVPIMGGWYRAVIVKIYDSEECEVMFVDYGGYSRLPTVSLRQIRADFMSLPFQATECLLANVAPIDAEAGWSEEANALFEELAQGQILQATIIGYSENGIPMVNLYKVQGISNVFINHKLVTRGFAHWKEIDA